MQSVPRNENKGETGKTFTQAKHTQQQPIAPSCVRGVGNLNSQRYVLHVDLMTTYPTNCRHAYNCVQGNTDAQNLTHRINPNNWLRGACSLDCCDG